MSAVVRAFGITDKGAVRTSNEDSFAIDEQLQLLIVADGMGGHKAGDVASELAVDTVLDCVRSHLDRRFAGIWPFGFDYSLSDEANVLRTAVHVANMQVLEAANASFELTGMGTTIVAGLVSGSRLAVAHAGDSRLYVASGGRLRLLTSDDSWMAAVLAGEPSADTLTLQHHPMRHALTNAVGAAVRADVHVCEEELRSGDRLVLTSDGVHGVIDDRRMEELVVKSAGPEEIADTLVRTALTRGSRDNCTAVAAVFTEG